MGQLTDLPAKGNGTAMGAFGDRLRREREMRGITLDEITESTKISRRHLEALEGEHFNQLPGGVFNKGFVRAYAHFLGIDEDQADKPMTTGIFAFGRNPIYVACGFVLLGQFLLFSNWILLLHRFML